MAKKKRQKYVRIVKKKDGGWTFKTQLGFLVATFLASFALLSTNITGNTISGGEFGGLAGWVGSFLFILGLIEVGLVIRSKNRLYLK